MSYAVMPFDDYKAACDAIREKIGHTELIKSGEMAEAIAGIIANTGTSGLAYDIGEFSIETDMIPTHTVANRLTIPHELGENPDFILVWTDQWAGITEAPYTDRGTAVGFVWFNKLTGMTQYATSVASVAHPIIVNFDIGVNDTRVRASFPGSAAYGITDSLLPTEEHFNVPTYGPNGPTYRAGVSYKYFVSKAWWNVGGAESAE